MPENLFSSRRYSFSAHDKSLPLFIETIGYNSQESTISRPAGYPYIHWLQTVSGEGNFRTGSEIFTLNEGEGIFLPANIPHQYEPAGKQWATVYLTFGGGAAESILLGLKLNQAVVLKDTQDNKLQKTLMDLMENVRKQPRALPLEVSSYIYNFLILLRKYGAFNFQPSLTSKMARIEPLIDWMSHYYSQNIGLQEMEQKAGISSQYLSKLFKETMGTSPYSYLVQVRIRKAKEFLIKEPELPLKEISRMTGFEDVSHFIATFRKKEGLTPGNYRKLHTETRELE
ncbi:AraC family transcriptional regulator [Salipaludibacillus aurantiacus]|uniref:AraC-type DNA-binding protein n=1 Tax=Salipaludibacillus aurantiacus TaxID=1601833 RepID=A0A1H9RUI9_9BACI|nr:AraC family transcriptional regulator [Salipaludibacillus aurantiacus]SER76218.1 AraC-type DNA-binding protein [Salipaludibacillus aurantiacus]